LYSEFCRRTRLRDRPDKLAPGHDSCVRFHFAFEFIRDQERHCLSPGKYLLEIVADALRIHPKSFWIELEIPDTVIVPKSEEERKKGLSRFQVRRHDKCPAKVSIR
jgi:hypothetical protein